jgi:hypothetical protein
MNEALDRYDGYQSIMQISGYMFPIKSKSISAECSFLPLTTSWGWATWKRAWSNYDPEARGWESLLSNPKEKSRFNFVDSFDFLGMLKKQFNGEIDSWAIRWYWSVFINHGLVLYPPTSMVRNDGFDGSGTHGWRTYAHALTHEYLDEPPCVNYPNGIVIDQEQMESVQKYFKTHGSTPRARIKRVLEKLRIFR